MQIPEDKPAAASNGASPEEITALLRQIHDVLIELLLRSSRDDDQLHDAALLQAWHRLERKTGRPVGPMPIPLPVPGVGTTSQADEDGADGC
ncbi:MAG: hypothetical protein KDC48_16640 [Planctomycetes bacterium]|nr:hypothetical protein [Planctomycetota bacterium]